MIEPAEIEALLKNALPDARIELVDLTGTRDHWQAVVVSSAFEGKSRIEQHRIVYAALGEAMKERIHALTLKTFTPDQMNPRLPEDVMRDEVKSKIEETIKKNRVTVFMKGTKSFPQCGFSARAVETLKRVGAEFETVNVLADPEIREGIKEYSSWPTIPQVYIDGKFVGGSDILLEMLQSGELEKLVKAGG